MPTTSGSNGVAPRRRRRAAQRVAGVGDAHDRRPTGAVPSACRGGRVDRAQPLVRQVVGDDERAGARGGRGLEEAMPVGAARPGSAKKTSPGRTSRESTAPPDDRPRAALDEPAARPRRQLVGGDGRRTRRPADRAAGWRSPASARRWRLPGSAALSPRSFSHAPSATQRRRSSATRGRGRPGHPHRRGGRSARRHRRPRVPAARSSIARPLDPSGRSRRPASVGSLARARCAGAGSGAR